MTEGWCPMCVPTDDYDEDGCCNTCGSTANGDGADCALACVSELAAVRAELSREHRRVRRLRRAVLAWAERYHGTEAQDYAQSADYQFGTREQYLRDAGQRHAALAMAFQSRARDRSHDDD